MKYFTIEEFTRSETARRANISNVPDEECRTNIENLVKAVLDPLREIYGKPIIVTSGYRCKELNRAVGGAAHSQHMSGCAADITGGGAADNFELMEIMINSDLPFDQLIDEHHLQWLHVSHVTSRANRGEVLRTKNGKTYEKIQR